MLIVQKFGGSSVSDAGKIERVAHVIAKGYRAGNDMVAVLSAQGDGTDALLARAGEITDAPPARELDMLLSVGEQISVSLMAMQLAKMGLPAVSLTGWQAGIYTNGDHGAARIEEIDTAPLRRALKKRRIVLVCGFQGIDSAGEITTLGRGGSDTTAVAIAAALHADRCQIFTDVEGIFSADPRKVPGAKKWDAVRFDEMLELASLGSQVLQSRCVELAMRQGVELEVLSSYTPALGTVVTAAAEKAGRRAVTAITARTDAACVAADSLPAGAAGKILKAAAGMGVGLITFSPGAQGDALCFTVSDEEADRAAALLEKNRTAFGFDRARITRGLAAVSAVGAGLMDDPGTTAAVLETLDKEKIAVHMVSTGEMKITVLVDGDKAGQAVSALHRRFFGR